MKNQNLVFFNESCSDLDYETIIKNEIQSIIMPVYLDGEEYIQDIKNRGDFADFIAGLKAKKTPSTSAISKQDYIDYFEPHLKNGKDCIYVSYSNKLTGSFLQMAEAVSDLKQKYPNQNVYLCDTTKVSLGAGVVVLQAAAAWQRGASHEEIKKLVEDVREHTEVMFVVDDLGHLKRGGRISAATALIGGMLNVKPILHMENGSLSKCGKANGFKKALNYIYEQFEKNFEPCADAPVFIIHADAKENAKYLHDMVSKFVNGRCEVITRVVGPTVMAHCGLGTVGIAYNRKKVK